jgi:hypothetical protein
VLIELKKRNHIAIGVDIDEIDITDATSVQRGVSREPCKWNNLVTV